MRNYYFACFFFLIAMPCVGQSNARFSEYRKAFTTYPFSDPNPIPDPSSKIYPYYRFDGFTNQPVQKEWKVVELENDYLKLLILPEVGGKIWAAIEKSSNRSFIYYNHVVKFRDVAMRGPWTSGGIEANYGIIGHTPNCATPVDYLVRSNEDGSVSCIIGVLDLLTQTNWRVEINLQKDKAYFTTRSFWYNTTSLEQPYYTWMNTGIKAKGNLEFIYPGTRYIGHEGEYSNWPINPANGKNISFYENNNFGGYKSYHVFGKYADFFGAYWHDEDFGMGRYSTHADKAGKKIWIWGLSQQGMIWEKLLSDTDGQYVEVQSGRLFNQNSENSSFTPFKHRGFSPYSADEWTEYWFPVMHTKGMVKANNWAALNLRQENGWAKLNLYALQTIHDTLVVSAGNEVAYKKFINLATASNFTDSFRTTKNGPLLVKIGTEKLEFNSDPEWGNLARPVDAPPSFNWNGAYGNFLMASECLDQKLYDKAEEKLRASLAIDSNFLPAISKLSLLCTRNLKFTEALKWATRALSIHTQDGESNYAYGLANAALGDDTNAADGFDLASLAPEFNAAANVERSKIEFRNKHYQTALYYAQNALLHDPSNMEALSLQGIALRLLGQDAKAKSVRDGILRLDPLNHGARFENELQSGGNKPSPAFVQGIRNEMPDQTLCELAGQYIILGLYGDAEQLLDLAGADPAVSYEKAWVQFKQGKSYQSALNTADQAKPGFNFPFRPETALALDWASKQTDDWKPKYLLALLYANKNRAPEANALLSGLNDKPDWAPFYSLRASLSSNKEAVEKDFLMAIQKDPAQWRSSKSLAEWYLAEKQSQKAMDITGPYFKAHPDNYIMGMLQAKTLLLNKKYKEADAILSTIHVIPFEGATDGRQLYKEAKLMLALEAMQGKNDKAALQYIAQSREWPERLGSGKPYTEEIDERLENWLTYQIYKSEKNNAGANASLQKIIAFTPRVDNTVSNFSMSNHLVTAWAYQALGKKEEADRFLQEWITKYPQNPVLKWCQANFTGQSYSIPTNARVDENYRVLEALINDSKK